MPKADYSETFVNFYTPVGSSLEVTEAKARQVERIIREQPEVQYTVTTINTGQVLGRNQVQIFVRLVDRHQRKLNVDQMSVPLRQRLESVPGITVTHVGLLDAVGGNKPIQLSLQGSDLRELDRLTAALMPRLAAIPGLVDLDSSSKPNKPAVSIRVKRDAASDAGLSVGAITAGLRALVAGETLGNWRADDDQNYDVKVRLTPASRNVAADIERLGLTVGSNADGSPRVVRLSQVAEVLPSSGANQINRRDMNREVEITANVSGRAAGQVAADIRAVLDEHRAAAGLQLPLRRIDQGHAGKLRLRGAGAGAGRDLHLHDPGQPVPQLPAAAGADELAAADADRRGAGAAGLRLDAEHVLDHRHRHADGAGDEERDPADRLRDPLAPGTAWNARAALLHAAQVRLRPILMTTLAMIFGMLPLALALTEGSEQRAPMGQAVIGGVITSSLLTLVVVPVIYC